MTERCDVCGYAWDEVGAHEVPGRLAAAASGFAAQLGSGRTDLAVRPADDVWSPIEYACHVRDVLLNLRDRIIVGLAEDNPTPKPMYAAVRLAAGLYRDEEPVRLAGEITLAAGLLGRTVAALDADALARPIFYPYPVPTTRTLLWVAAQALHEAEHHLDDITPR